MGKDTTLAPNDSLATVRCYSLAANKRTIAAGLYRRACSKANRRFSLIVLTYTVVSVSALATASCVRLANADQSLQSEFDRKDNDSTPHGSVPANADSPQETCTSAETQTDESGDTARMRQFRRAFAAGKVLTVERYGDRFDVRTSITEDDGISVGLNTQVFIGRDLTEATVSTPDGFLKNVVASGQVVDVRSDGSTCNIGPGLGSIANGIPKEGDDVLILRKASPATFIVAKHVVLHGGRIVQWDEVPDQLAELNEAGVIEPSLRFTKAMRGAQDQRTKDFKKWCKETTGGGFSSGSISGLAGEYYDSITGDEDLRPKTAGRIGTVIAEGSPVDNAEIVLFMVSETQRREVYVEHGRLRGPHSQPSQTRSAPNGRFAVYPESDRFQLLVLHEKGTALVTSDEWPKRPEIVLNPWAQISGKFDGPIEFDETAQFETRLESSGWATIRLKVWDTPLFADRSFKNVRIPPGQVMVSRAIASPRGGATSIAHESFKLAPGESRKLSIGPLPDRDRALANEYLKNENR